MKYKFTAQAIFTADVEIEADSLEEALHMVGYRNSNLRLR